VRIASDVGNSEFHWRELQTFVDGTEVIYYLRISINGTRTIWTGPVYVTYDSSIPTAVGAPGLERLQLGAPYPNPAGGNVSFRLVLPVSDERTEVGVFDLSGRRVRTLLEGVLPAGERTVVWDGRSDDGRSAKSGVYFVRVMTRMESQSRRVLFLR
jgi:hypothetical protein